MRLHKKKTSAAGEHTGRRTAVNPQREKMPTAKKYLLLLLALCIAAVMIIVLAVVLLGAEDESRCSEYMALAQESFEQEKYENALRYLRKVNEIESNSDTLLMMAACYEKLENYDKALQVLRMLDTRERAISSRIADLERRKAQLEEKKTVVIAGKEYPSDSTVLTLDDLGLADEDVEDVLQLYSLTSLSMAGNSISDFSALSALGGLTSLDLSRNMLSDVSAASALTGLRSLFLDENPIKDFSPLYQLTNLSVLSIKGIEISSEQLTELSNALPNCAIHSDTATESVMDISVGGVTFKSDVSELNLSGLGIYDISALANCKELKKLNLSGNEISDLYALMNLPKLEYLDISFNQVSDLRPLMGLSTLKQINASDNLIASTAPVGPMTALTKLDISNNPISDFSGFEINRSLLVLSVKNTGLNDEGLECLSHLTSLNELNIEDNPDISGECVDAMIKKIGSCALIHSKLYYTADLDGHPVKGNTTELDLNSAGISDISALGRLGCLETLNLAKNTINDIYIFQHTDSRFTLKTLDLSGNYIADITPVSFVVNLEYLDISNNSINSVMPLMTMTNLKELYLSGNPLSDEQVEALRNVLVNCKIYW